MLARDLPKQIKNSTMHVHQAARVLRANLDSGPAERLFAAREVEQAADQLRDQMPELRFSPAGESQGPGSLNEVFAQAAAKAYAAELLLGAGAALGQSGLSPAPEALDAALQDFNAFGAEGAALEPSEFRFQEETQESSDPEAAFELFTTGVNRTLDTIVAEAERVILSAFEVVSKNRDSILSALALRTGWHEVLEKVGGMIRKGFEILSEAFQMVRSIVESRIAESAFNTIIRDLWSEISVRRALERCFDVDRTRNDISTLQPSASSDEIHRAAKDLKQLSEGFAVIAGSARILISVVKFASGWVLTALSHGTAVIAVPAAYALIVVTVVVIGMDYTDSGKLVQSVAGVREVISRVAGATGGPA